MIPRYSLLSRADLEKIHNTALEILETVGVRVGRLDSQGDPKEGRGQGKWRGGSSSFLRI